MCRTLILSSLETGAVVRSTRRARHVVGDLERGRTRRGTHGGELDQRSNGWRWCKCRTTGIHRARIAGAAGDATEGRGGGAAAGREESGGGRRADGAAGRRQRLKRDGAQLPCPCQAPFRPSPARMPANTLPPPARCHPSRVSHCASPGGLGFRASDRQQFSRMGQPE